MKSDDEPGPCDVREPIRRGELVWLAVIVALYLVLAGAFVRATPVMEVSDEAAHFGYVVDWRRTGQLPRATDGANPFSQQEAFQPPLYYALILAATANIALDDAEKHYAWVPGAPVGRADLPGPRNMREPVRPRESPPGAGVAVLRGRAVSLALSLATVLLVWACARAAGLRPWQRLFATGLAAFNPMFLHIGTSVNNDVLVTTLGAATSLACLMALDRRITARTSFGLGLLAGLTTLAKLSGAVFGPAVAYVVLRGIYLRRAPRTTALWAPAGFLAVTGWWFALQYRLYGMPFLGSRSGEEIGNVRSVIQPLALVREWGGFFKSFWGVFGGFNIVYPGWVYLLMLWLTIALLLGAALLVGRRPRDARLHLLVGVVAVNLAAAAYWTSLMTASQGRLMFPTLAAIAVVSAAGLGSLSRPLARGFCVLVLAGLLTASAYAAGWLIPGSYRWPRSSTSSSAADPVLAKARPEQVRGIT